MHSSRMRTGRMLTVFRWRTPPPRKFQTPPRKFQTPLQKISHPPGPGRYPTPVDRMTHACENITLAKTSFRPVIIQFNLHVCLLFIGLKFNSSNVSRLMQLQTQTANKVFIRTSNFIMLINWT